MKYADHKNPHKKRRGRESERESEGELERETERGSAAGLVGQTRVYTMLMRCNVKTLNHPVISAPKKGSGLLAVVFSQACYLHLSCLRSLTYDLSLSLISPLALPSCSLSLFHSLTWSLTLCDLSQLEGTNLSMRIAHKA